MSKIETEIVYSSLFNNHDDAMHPEHAERTDVMIKALKESFLHEYVKIIKPEILPEEKLYKIHSIDMIMKIKALSKLEEQWIDTDTYVSKDDYITARYAAGGTVQLCKKVINDDIRNGYALVRPPGHHATSTKSMGFCLFNNIALGAQELIEGNKKVLIFDLDVHHGNGTQEIFYKTDKVLYQSFHLSPHFPGTGFIDEIGVDEGEGFNINAPLHYYNGEQTIQLLLDEIFLPIAKQYKPDIILVSTGYDGHYSDNLGGLRMTINYFGTILKMLQKVQPKMVLTLEGGYNLDIIDKCFLSQIGQLCQKQVQFNDKKIDEKINKELIKSLKKIVKEYWNI